jgi:ABC-type sugar transport system permease subunit
LPAESVQSSVALRGARRRGSAIAGPLRWIAYLVPAAVLTGLFLVYPLISTVRLALFDWAGYGPQHFVGGKNFKDLLHDGDATTAVLHSLEFAVVTTLVTVGVGTAIALALYSKVRGSRVFQFAIFLPVILPSTFIALTWANGFDPIFGWFTELLHLVGISSPWLGDRNTGIFAVSLAYILQTTGFPMIIVLAALGDIPPEIQEAATLDGAGPLRRAIKVSLPLVRDAVTTVALLQLIWGFTNFDFAFAMVNGGPGTGTDVASTFVFFQAFINHRFGYGAAAAVYTSALLAMLAMVALTIFRPRGIRRAG